MKTADLKRKLRLYDLKRKLHILKGDNMEFSIYLKQAAEKINNKFEGAERCEDTNNDDLVLEQDTQDDKENQDKTTPSKNA